MHGEVFAVFACFVSGFAMIFGIFYLKTRENLAMIEKGMNPKEYARKPAPYKNLKWALLLIGAGSGLLAAYLIEMALSGKSGRHHDEHPAIYFSLIAIGGGLGLLSSYRIEKKWWDENKDKL